MDWDTVIMSGDIRFKVNKEEQTNQNLKPMVYMAKEYMDSGYHEDIEEYIKYRDFREPGHFEYGDVVSIQSDDVQSADLINGDKIPFYLHSSVTRISDVLTYLKNRMNKDLDTYGDTFDGLLIEVEKYVTTFKSIKPEIRSKKMSVKFTYNQYSGYTLKTSTSQNFHISTSLDSLGMATDIFSFSTDSTQCFKPFIELIESVTLFPGEYSHDVKFNTQLEEEIARLLIQSIVFKKDEETLGVKPFTLKDLRYLTAYNLDVKLSLGVDNAMDVFRKLVPIISKNIMSKGRLI